MGIAADFVLIVVAGLAGAVVARSLGLPLLVGYVAAGVVVGPHTAGPTVAHIDDIELLAEIGVALLLFALGLELSFRDLRAVRRVALIGGPIQIGLTAWFGGWVARTALDMPMTDAIWFGAMVSLSSTMVVLKTLAAAGTTSTLASRVMIGLLVVQDLAVVPMLIVLPHVGDASAALPRLAQASLVAAAFLLAMVLVGTKLLPALLRRVAAWGSRELFLVAVVAAGVGIGSLTFQLGLSFAIGAFVAGIVLSESELSHQALSDVAPLRDVFGLVFFVSVGMLFDPRYVTAHAGQVALIVAIIVAGKSLICGLVARAFGYENGALDRRPGPLADWRVQLRSRPSRIHRPLHRQGHVRPRADLHRAVDGAVAAGVLRRPPRRQIVGPMATTRAAVSGAADPQNGAREPRRRRRLWPNGARRRGCLTGRSGAIRSGRAQPRGAGTPLRAGRPGRVG